MEMSSWVERAGKVLMKNVGRLPVVFARGEGARLYDVDGKEYIDFLSGIAVQAVGHSHPAVVAALQKQAEKIIHVSNFFCLEEQVLLAEKLAALSGLERVFFANSGAEANEAAIKLARKYGRTRMGGKYEIITAYHSFHGRTMGALAATGQPKYQEAFRPLPEGFRYAHYNDLASWEAAITPQTCAVLLELVQGEGGVIPVDPAFFHGLVTLCRQHGLLLMIDEVQTGLGRTGKFFAWEHLGVKPDIMTLAKALGGGVPIGAMLAKEEVATAFEPGDHSTTVGGGGMAFAAALANLKIIEEEKLPERAARLGAELKAEFQSWQQELPVIKEVRGWGLLLALELAIPAQPVMRSCLEQGLIINAVAPTALRLVPPLNISEADLAKGLAILKQVLKEAQ
ncbi:MAG TPA: acetylornithine transaminase [Firmicutes bacterium]|uniref:Acetylornithine aminotransferase n=1 Tax=Capillibacterium thermochitinicola TaxID=2699427 RepID=A0A8J6I0B8_9FIRM|nr:acetylornithine transaminase [Capillibacterium thermochitinicola]MBA2132928.1 acetylornithine transaminase [Capillibacterium thermochitinicola]HHW11764.1 acetylornithine transaminase [Bacillota bacterium]